MSGEMQQWGQDTGTTTGLSYGYIGGSALSSSTGEQIHVASSVVTLANNTTNYVQRTYAGVVSANTTGFSPASVPMAVVTTSAGAIGTVVDWRPEMATPVVYYPSPAGETGVVDYRYPVGDVRRYGAINDGVTDATAAFQAAADALPAKGGTLSAPAGRFLITGTIDIRGDNTFVEGNGTRVAMDAGTIIDFKCTTAGSPAFRFAEPTSQEGQFTLEGGVIDGANTIAASCSGIEIHVPNVTIQNTRIRRFVTGNGIAFVDDLAVPPFCGSIVNCCIQLNLNGIWNDGDAGQMVITRCRIEGNTYYGIYANNGSKLVVLGNTIENNGYVNTAYQNVWPALGSTSDASISGTATGYHRTSGDFVADGITAGAQVTVSGFSTAKNNGVKFVTAVTSTDVTVFGGGAVEAASPTAKTIVQEYAPQMLIENRGEVMFHGNYLESFAGQPHDELTILGVSVAAGAIDIRDNRFVSYGARAIGIGLNGGAVDNVTIDGANYFVKSTGIGIEAGRNVRGLTIGNNGWTDSFQDGTGTATRFNVDPNVIGSIWDQNRFTNGHHVLHQRTDLQATNLVSDNTVLTGATAGDQATGSGSYYRVLRAIGRVSGGAAVRADVESTLGNAAMFNAVAGTLPVAPGVALAGAGAGNVTAGTHLYKITFVDAAGESTGGPASASINVTAPATNGRVAITGIQVGNSPVTARKIYRTTAGTTSGYYLVDTIANNTATSYTDNVADGSLGAVMPAASTTADLGCIMTKVANGTATIGNVPDNPVAFIANNVEQARFASDGLFNARLGFKVAGTQVVGARQAAISSPTAPSAAYVQAEAASMKTAVDAIRAALMAHGLIG
jgi:hypothetical protein